MTAIAVGLVGEKGRYKTDKIVQNMYILDVVLLKKWKEFAGGCCTLETILNLELGDRKSVV